MAEGAASARATREGIGPAGVAPWTGALGLVVLTLGGGVGAVVFSRGTHEGFSGNDVATTLLDILFLVVGFVLAIRRPRNPIGWIFLGCAACFMLSAAASSYGVLDYTRHRGTLPLGGVALLLNEFWAPAIVLLSASVLLFPDGRTTSRLTRLLLLALSLASVVWLGGAFAIAISSLVSHHVRIDPGGDLYAIDHPVGAWAWWPTVAQPAFFATTTVVWITWLGTQLPLYRRTYGDRRLQLKWLYGGVTVCAVGGLATVFLSSSSSEVLSVLGDIGTSLLGALPLAVGIAVMKFHLYEVDKVVSRTLSYLVVSGVVAAAYVGAITLLTRAIGLASPEAVAASTLVAALAFNPARRRIQHGVDRRFNRARYDAEKTVTAFAARLREAIELESVRHDLASVIASSMEPSQLGVWVLASDGARRPATRDPLALSE